MSVDRKVINPRTSQLIERSREVDQMKDEIRRVVQTILALGQASPTVFAVRSYRIFQKGDMCRYVCDPDTKQREWIVQKKKDGLVVSYTLGRGLECEYTARSAIREPGLSVLKQVRQDLDVLVYWMCKEFFQLNGRIQEFIQPLRD